MSPPITAIVLTRDEQEHLGGCLASIRPLTTDIVVLDSGSSDSTLEIARKAGARIERRAFDGFAGQRNAALELQCLSEWVIFVDADERLTPAGCAEIHAALATAEDRLAALSLPRSNDFFGVRLSGGGWWPDYQTRVLRRDRVRYDPSRQVHEVPLVDGDTRRLTEPLIHLNYSSWDEFRARQRAYSVATVEQLRHSGLRARRRTYVSAPAREALRRFVMLRGYRDGLLGARLALAMALEELWIRRMLRTDRNAPDCRALLGGNDSGPLATARGTNACRCATRTPVSVIVVSYNVRELLLTCVESLVERERRGEVAEVVVVDNASIDASADAIRRAYPGVRVIDAPNRGYGAGINRGVTCTTAPYVLALNPDTVVPPGTIEALACYLDRQPRVAIVAPRLRYPDGSEQPSRRRFPTRLTPIFESTILHRAWPGNAWARRYHLDDARVDESEPVDWVVGACMLIRRSALDACGGFDESFRMYSEEVELCWRLSRHGWRVAWLPDVEVVHYESASAGQNTSRRQIEFDASRVRLAQLIYGRPTGEVVRLALLGGYLVELAIETAKWLLGHRRALRRARMTLYRRALASRLSTGVD